MPTVLPRFLQTPRWHACCEEEQQARQRPMRCRYRDLDSLSPVGRPRPPPQEVRLNRWHENSKAVFPPTNPAHVPAQSPPLTRHATRLEDCAGTVNRCLLMQSPQCPRFLRRSAPGQPPSGFRGVALDATSSIFDRLPTSSFQQQHIRPVGPSDRPAPQSRVHCGNRASVFALRASPRQAAPILGILLHARSVDSSRV